MQVINVGFLPDRGRIGLWIYTEVDGVRFQLTDEGSEEHLPGTYSSASVELDDAAARALMTKLWAEGIRPDGWSHEQTNDALRHHLEDMRRLALPEETWKAMDEARKRR
jgi:hypothetical protein